LRYSCTDDQSVWIFPPASFPPGSLASPSRVVCSTRRSQWLSSGHFHTSLVLLAACSLSSHLASLQYYGTERGMLPARRSRRSGLPSGACAGPGSSSKFPLIGAGPSSKFPLARGRAIQVPPDFQVVFACASPSQCFWFCPQQSLSTLPAYQTDLGRPPSANKGIIIW
jgi:hypothetical protein